MNPADYHADELLRDGNPIHIRAIRPDDRERLLAHFHGLSQQSIYYRFIGLKHDLNDRELSYLTEIDFVNHAALVATLIEQGEERIIGVARYIRGANPARAEVAFAIIDDWQGHGIATLLLQHISSIARSAGVTEFEAIVLGDNSRMLEVFEHSGLPGTRSADGGTIRVTLQLGREPG
ncbi:MAG: GNAT family N-acetyltransferase [Candidatus Binataceae bacterium]